MSAANPPTTLTGSVTQSTPTEIVPIVAPLGAGSAVAGVPSGSVTVNSNVMPSPFGAKSNYTVVVQVPVPFLTVNLNAAKAISSALTQLGVPAAVAWLVKNASTIFGPVVNDAVKMLKAIPQGTITIQVRVGVVTVLNIQLVAVKVPLPVTTPTFILALPNLAANLPGLPLSKLPPIVLEVPIPYPVVKLSPILAVSGGQIKASAQPVAQPGTSPTSSVVGQTTPTQPVSLISPTAQPQPITNPIYLPALK